MSRGLGWLESNVLEELARPWLQPIYGDGDDPRRWNTVRFLELRWDVEDSALRRSVKALERKGWVQVRYRPRQTSYRLPPDGMGDRGSEVVRSFQEARMSVGIPERAITARLAPDFMQAFERMYEIQRGPQTTLRMNQVTEILRGLEADSVRWADTFGWTIRVLVGYARWASGITSEGGKWVTG